MLVLASLPQGLHADEQAPRIGLVLAGGGARGLAHVGVIKYLEEHNIRVSAIAGTSMGAVVGGLYASGMTANKLRRVVDTLDWHIALSDYTPREQLSFRRKQDDFDYLVRAKLRFRDGRLRLPQGLVEGQNLNMLLHRLVQPVSGIHDFDQLPIPFRAVAADITTGEAVILGSGDLANAMRASMSIPGLFTPVDLDGKLLVDGGIANNVPVDVAQAMGVDRLIVVDVGSPLAGRESMSNVLSMLDQLTTILTRKNSEAQLARMQPEDILILPALDAAALENMDFDRAADAIQLGYDAARQQAQRLAMLATPASESSTALARRIIRSPVIARIEIINDSHIPDQLLRNKIRQPLGKTLRKKQLQRDITEIYALDQFARVDYDIDTIGEEHVLRVHAVANPVSASYLKLGLSWEQDSKDDNDFGLRASWRQKALNSLGAEWYTLVQIGGQPLFGTELYQPLDLEQRFFVDASYRYQERRINISENNNIVARAHVDEHRLEAAAGMHIRNDAALRLGSFVRTANTNVEIGAPRLSSGSENDAGFFAEFKYDSLDRPFFPTSGTRLLSRADISRSAWGADSNYEAWSSSALHAFRLGRRSSLNAVLRWSQLDLDRAENALTLPSHAYTLGGFLQLSGYTRDSLAGNYLAQANLVYYRRLNEQSLLPVDFPVYAGGSIEAANVWTHSGDVNAADLIYAGSLFLGVDSPLGPVYLGVGIGEHDQRALYLRIGQLFD